MSAVPLSKRGTLTLPPAIRRRLGLDKITNPMLLIEERDGGIFLRPSAAMPVRDLPAAIIKEWIADDESEMTALDLKNLRAGK